MKAVAHFRAGLYLVTLALSAAASASTVGQAVCTRWNQQGKCAEWKEVDSRLGVQQRRVDWRNWDAGNWDKWTTYCGTPNTVHSEYQEACQQINGIAANCYSGKPTGEYKRFCDNAGLSQPMAMKLINAVAENFDGVKSCSAVFDVFAKGFDPRPGGMPEWPKQPDRAKARPQTIKQMAINMDEINSVQLIHRSDLAVTAAQFAYKQKKAYDDVKDKVELTERFLKMTQEVKHSQLLTTLAFAGTQVDHAECFVKEQNLGGPEWTACINAANTKTPLRVTALMRFTEYINETDVIKCLTATEKIKTVLKE